ncbi:unnamed protein product [Prunus armeniaca]|uniref:Uncharacterized protein n=1 Tax=Prunus armeniaca TaxID=36596 RepID=A0A6J5WJW3_PRUAR|nr:unnamed protein product [Prunus armeniaca]CAB4300365.1 unnamed protein product [Prunus armeniaca]
MGSAPAEQLETEGQGISNDATQHKQHEYRVGVEEKLVWKSQLDQRHGCGNGEGKDAMVDHIHRVGLLCWKVVDQQLLVIHKLKINHPHIRKMIYCHVWLGVGRRNFSLGGFGKIQSLGRYLTLPWLQVVNTDEHKRQTQARFSFW